MLAYGFVSFSGCGTANRGRFVIVGRDPVEEPIGWTFFSVLIFWPL